MANTKAAAKARRCRQRTRKTRQPAGPNFRVKIPQARRALEDDVVADRGAADREPGRGGRARAVAHGAGYEALVEEDR